MCLDYYCSRRALWCICDSCIGHMPARLSVETCARAFNSVRLNPMSHIVSPVCSDQLSPITLCNRSCGLLESRVKIPILFLGC